MVKLYLDEKGSANTHWDVKGDRPHALTKADEIRQHKMGLLLLLCCVWSIQGLLLQPVQGFVGSFTTNHTLNKLAVDTTSGMVYIGATNQLYQLDLDLKLNDTDVTGPVLDNPS